MICPFAVPIRRSPHYFRIAFGMAALGLLPLIGSAQDTDRNYHLYVGLDLLLPRGEEEKIPVENLTRNQAGIANGAGLDRIPLRDVPARAPKVSRSPVTIAGLETDKTYTINTDGSVISIRNDERSARDLINASVLRSRATPGKASAIQEMCFLPAIALANRWLAPRGQSGRFLSLNGEHSRSPVSES